MSIKSFIRNYIWKTSEPWADIVYNGNKLTVNGYNAAFINEQKVKLGNICDLKSDQEIINIFIDRKNIAREEPKLDVLHLGIDGDGRVKVKLDWNQAFINHLKDHGIVGETEDEAIQAYLQLITTNEQQENSTVDEMFSKDQIEKAFSEMNNELTSEFNEAKKQIRRRKRAK